MTKSAVGRIPGGGSRRSARRNPDPATMRDADRVKDLFQVVAPPLILEVLRRREVHEHGKDVIATEASRDEDLVEETAGEKPGSGQEHNRQGDFDNHHTMTKAAALGSNARVTGSERVAGGGLRQSQGRRETKDQRCEE